jgi:hypothetical protein
MYCTVRVVVGTFSRCFLFVSFREFRRKSYLAFDLTQTDCRVVEDKDKIMKECSSVGIDLDLNLTIFVAGYHLTILISPLTL